MFIRHIIGTIGVRVASAGISVLLLLLHARYLGDTALGTITLIVLGVSLTSLLAHVMGGGVLVYFAPRASAPKLLLPSYLWGIASLILATLVITVFGLVPEEYVLAVFAIALLEVFAYNHHSLLIGKERIPVANTLVMVRMLLLGGGVSAGIFLFDIRTPWVYVYAILLANTWWMIASFISLRKELFHGGSWSLDKGLIRKMLKLGTFSQSGNALQLMNYRLDIYLLEAFFPATGLALVGRYTAANQVGESLWIVPRAIASVQYGRIANSENKAYSRSLSLRLMGLSMLLAAVGLCVFLLIPAEGYVWLLGERFRDTGTILLYLAPGILFLAGSIPLSPYFSGRGKHVVNTWAAAVGLVVTLCVGLWLIPDLGVQGAAITSSISYGLTWVVQLAVLLLEDKRGD